eukprot:6213737-Lingulodinium_polyedra.AAC.1
MARSCSCPANAPSSRGLPASAGPRTGKAEVAPAKAQDEHLCSGRALAAIGHLFNEARFGLVVALG